MNIRRKIASFENLHENRDKKNSFEEEANLVNKVCSSLQF